MAVGANAETHAAAAAGTGFKTTLLQVARLAHPLAWASLGTHLTGLVDTLFAGRLGSAALGGVGLGAGIFFAIFAVGLGAVLGLDSWVGQALGRKDLPQARSWVWQGVFLSLVLSVPLMGALVWVAFLLPDFGVTHDVATTAQEYLLGRLPALPIGLCVLSFRALLQGLGKGRAQILAALALNITNIVANGVFAWNAEIWTDIGATGLSSYAAGLGALGVGLASTCSSLGQGAAVWMALWSIDRASLRWHRPRWQGSLGTPGILNVARVGLPIGLQLLTEVGVFALAGIGMGRMGAVVMAGHQIALQYVSLSFALALGIGAATATSVGKAMGAKNFAGMRQAGLAGGLIASCIMGISALVFACGAEPLGGLISADPKVCRMAAKLLLVGAAFQWVDGAQVIAAGALRGMGATGFLFLANGVGHGLIGLPLGYWAAFGAGRQAPYGLWWGLTLGLCVVALALWWRFFFLTGNLLRRSKR